MTFKKEHILGKQGCEAEEVVLVDSTDNQAGVSDKLSAHRDGLLHRAFSVFIVNSRGEWLIQKRAAHKYHSGGLWSNACCSHPRPSETVLEAAHRRLAQEMGISCELDDVYHFIYKTTLNNDLTEHELDHVLIGFSEQSPDPDPDEVSEWKWEAPEDIRAHIKSDPQLYTFWFKQAFDEVVKHIDRSATQGDSK